MHNLKSGKNDPKMWVTSAIFIKPTQSNQSPIERKFAQSGHFGYKNWIIYVVRLIKALEVEARISWVRTLAGCNI
jgi:hypothetical protein